MATAAVHQEKADEFWKLAQQLYAERRDEFLCLNLAFYTLAHLIEAGLAIQHKHPTSPPRGVPHADRGAKFRKYWVGNKWVEAEYADTYDELNEIRHAYTFADDGIPDRDFMEHFMAIAKPFIERLKKVLESPPSPK